MACSKSRRRPAGHGIPDAQVLLDPADWNFVRSVVDVGGGTGTLLAEVLRSRPRIRGTLVDLPRTIARSDEVFQAAGGGHPATVCGGGATPSVLLSKDRTRRIDPMQLVNGGAIRLGHLGRRRYTILQAAVAACRLEFPAGFGKA